MFTYLGIEIDSERMELRLPEGKLLKLINLLKSILDRHCISKRELESLGGHLSHCSHVIKGGKISCKNVYNLYRQMIERKARFMEVPTTVKSDLKWWLHLCKYFNGSSRMVKDEFHHAMVSDSSLKGFGVYLGQDWCAGTWSDLDCIPLTSSCNHIVCRPLVEEFDHTNINVLEPWPILVGFKRWMNLLRDKKFVVFTDNTQVMYINL